MKAIKATLATLTLLSLATVAQAATVTFAATGEFGNGLTSIMSGGSTLTYTPQGGSVTVNAGQIENIQLGDFVLSSSTVAPTEDAFNTTFTLFLSQTSPIVDLNNPFTNAIVQGNVSGTTSNLFVDFDTLTITLDGGVTYTITNNGDGPGGSPVPGRINIPAPSAGASAVITANVELAEVPEPGTYALMGAGLIGMVALRRRISAR